MSVSRWNSLPLLAIPTWVVGGMGAVFYAVAKGLDKEGGLDPGPEIALKVAIVAAAANAAIVAVSFVAALVKAARDTKAERAPEAVRDISMPEWAPADAVVERAPSFCKRFSKYASPFQIGRPQAFFANTLLAGIFGPLYFAVDCLRSPLVAE